MSTAAPLRELIAWLDDLLDPAAVSDYGPNGLQVEGRPEVRRLITGVSACRELFERAAELEADAVVVHHGLFWQGMPYELVGVQYRRVRTLIENGLSLVAYHLPLDRHPEVGNNALACHALGLEGLEPFGHHAGASIGFAGSLAEPITGAELVRRCRDLYGQEPLAFTSDRPIRRVGVISGGAQKEFHQAIAAGLDAYVTGEVSEWVTNLARETGVAYLAAGHYATERLGVRELGSRLADHFGIEVDFVDVPNPV